MSDEFFSGIIVAPKRYGQYSLAFDGGINYSNLDAFPESVKWWISTFSFLAPVIKRSKEKGLEVEEVESLKKFIINFFFYNKDGETQSFSRAWDGHAVSKRSLMLLDAAKTSGLCIDNILNDHLNFLVKEKNFQGHWNHGLDQSHALAKLAQYLHDEFALEVAVNRLTKTLSNLVDEEGVSIEQSVHYHRYNYFQIKRICRLIEQLDRPECKRLADSLIERLVLMEVFLAHATMPNGRYFEIGDTPTQKAACIEGTVAEYAATQGKKASPPNEVVKVYDSGYVFGRTGWGLDKKFSDESCFCVRFGPRRVIHGHHDHMSIQYYTNGRLVLRDGGFHGYTHDKFRNLLRSQKSHNAIYIKNKGAEFQSNPTVLVEREISERYCKFVLLGKPYRGVVHERTIFFINKPESIVVRDSVRSESYIEAVQKWQFGDDLTFVNQASGCIVSSDNTVSLKQHYPFKDFCFYDSDHEDNPSIVAGSSLYELKKCPALLTERDGKNVSFLTTMVFGNNANKISVKRKRMNSNGVRQKLMVEDEDDVAELNFLSDTSICCVCYLRDKRS